MQAQPNGDVIERELHGLEIVRAGIVQGLEFMPGGCVSMRAFAPLVVDVDERIDTLTEWMTVSEAEED